MHQSFVPKCASKNDKACGAHALGNDNTNTSQGNSRKTHFAWHAHAELCEAKFAPSFPRPPPDFVTRPQLPRGGSKGSSDAEMPTAALPFASAAEPPLP